MRIKDGGAMVNLTGMTLVSGVKNPGVFPGWWRRRWPHRPQHAPPPHCLYPSTVIYHYIIIITTLAGLDTILLSLPRDFLYSLRSFSYIYVCIMSKRTTKRTYWKITQLFFIFSYKHSFHLPRKVVSSRRTDRRLYSL